MAFVKLKIKTRFNRKRISFVMYKDLGLVMGHKIASASLADKHKDSNIVNSMVVACNKFTLKKLADLRSSFLGPKNKLKKRHLKY